MRNTLIFTVMLILLAGAVWMVAFPQEQLREVAVVPVERGPMTSSVRVTGRVINDLTVTLTALVDGQIHQMNVDKGERVKAGQVLAVLDEREAEVLERRADAIVAREAESVQQLARRFERLQKVLQVGGETTQVVDDAEAALRAAKARLRVAEAERRVAEIRREKSQVTAPFDGIITEKTTEVGQWLEAGIKLFTLVGIEGWEIEAHVDAADSGVVHLGQPVTVSCDAFPGREWTETVNWIAPMIILDDGDALNTFAVRTTLGPDAPPLLLGQQVDLEIHTAQREDTLKLPYSALIESDQGPQVAVLKDGKVQLRQVRTGIEDLTHVEIVSGLSPGATVILPRGQSLTEGEAVVAIGG